MITAFLAGLCAVLILLTITLLEISPFKEINTVDFLLKAVPLFLIVFITTYIIL